MSALQDAPALLSGMHQLATCLRDRALFDLAIENTVRYLGGDIEDALALAADTEIYLWCSSRSPRGDPRIRHPRKNSEPPQSASPADGHDRPAGIGPAANLC